MSNDPVVLAIVGLYLVGMLAIGVWVARRKIASADDFMVAGRRLPWFVLAATLAATEVGGGSSMGVVKKAYGEWGLGAAWYIWTMALTFLVFAWLAPTLTRTRCRTIPQYFSQRYGPASAVVTAVLMIAALIGLTAVQMVATGLVVSVMTGAGFRLAVLAAGLIVTIYTYWGGMWSVSLTDFVQWFFIVIGLAAAIPYAVGAGGGVQPVLAALPPEATSLLSKIGVGEILSLCAIYVTSFLVGQEAIQRLYSAKDERHARRGALATSGFYLLFGFIPPALGLLALALTRQGVLQVGELTRLGDNAVLPLLAQACLPAPLTGVLFAGLISATMSSADSNLLGAASIWANDLMPLGLRRELTPEGAMIQSRRAVLVIGAAATVVAALNFEDLITVLKFAFSLRAAGTFFPFVLGHFWKRGSNAGALASLLGATAVMAIFMALNARPLGLDPVLPALATGLALYVGGSLATDRG